MHPPFFVVDHRIDYDPRPFEEKRLTRRTRPQSLRFDRPTRIYPVETFDVAPRVIVRAPGPGLRDQFARFLYRLVAGQPFPGTAVKQP